MADEVRLPIKIVLTQESDYQKPKGGGGDAKLFGDVTPELRDLFVSQIEGIHDFFKESFARFQGVPAVAKVILKEDALAKSHRPAVLLDKNTCPLIGVRDFGELLVSVTPLGLENLANKIKENNSKQNTANISAIERIEPYKPEDALRDCGLKSRRKSRNVKFRLFRHCEAVSNDRILKAFRKYVSDLELPDPEEIRYAPSLRIYKIRDVSPRQERELANFIGTQSVSEFPSYRSVRTRSIPLKRAKMEDFPAPSSTIDYPIVGIIDSGINPTNALLGNWLTSRDVYVADEFLDHDHGSFVAGLIANAWHMNHSDDRFPNVQSRFVDVVAIPGHGDALTEDQLLAILEEVIPKYPEVKVWNLSLGKDDPACTDDAFSDLAIALDHLQARYDITFVIAAGNYQTSPYRSWPPEDLGEDDRIRPPADSVRGVTVGSIAHIHTPKSRVKREEPSPFSRRGPGGAFLPKPDVSHYGGNCSQDGQYNQTGILSLNGSGHLAENVGTSFATPLVSTILANIQSAVTTSNPRLLSKALLIHSAVLQSEIIDALNLRYRGFGIPGDLTSILTCSSWAATLIFEPLVHPRDQFIKNDFPIPDCFLLDGKVRGDFIITLAYDPPLDPQYGSEYCRRNVEVSLGTYDIGSNGKPVHKKRVPEEPGNLSELYERQRIEHGFKWSPVKVYRQSIPKGIAGQTWRLLVAAHDRDGFHSDEATPTAIIITMIDKDPDNPVYDQVINRMALSGWITQDLQIQEHVRARLRR